MFIAVLSSIIFGFSFSNSALAVTGDPIPGVEVRGTQVEMMASSDLGVESVGTLPTSQFYFFKQLNRSITRFFTFNAVDKAELELTITNQIAAEIIAVEKSSPNNTEALKKALENYAEAQERLNTRLAKLSENSGNPNVVKLLEEVDEKTAKHTALLEDLAEKNSGQLRFEVVGDSLKKAQDNTLKTFTITVTPVNDAPTLKQKAEEQLRKAETSIKEANKAVESNVAESKQTQGTSFGEKIQEGELGIFDRWGNSITNAEGDIKTAKKAVAEGKYGEAYGLARSVEAVVRGVWVAAGDINGDGNMEKLAPTASTTVSAKSSVKISDDQSPIPSDRLLKTPSASPVIEKTENLESSTSSDVSGVMREEPKELIQSKEVPPTLSPASKQTTSSSDR